MVITLWSVKGGSGVSVVAAGLAAVLARGGTDVLLVDLDGDQPALLGLPTPDGPGVRDWLAVADGDPAALGRLELDAAPSLRLVPRGDADGWSPERTGHLVDVLEADRRAVVVDAGPDAGPASALRSAGTSLLVVRPCYLALRRAVRARATADGVVLVEEPGRSLDVVDVERALGAPVRAVIPWDPAVARAVDAGLLTARLPRGFARSLASVT